MKIFDCPSCGGQLFFRNTSCACGAEVAYDPETDAFAPLETPCGNRAAIGCNWTAEPLHEPDAKSGLCRSCRMTEEKFAREVADNLAHWAETELAKRWVLANLGRWGWFRSGDTGRRPVFHMRSEDTPNGDAHVIMGHANGVITLNVSEADDVERLRRRKAFDEAQRTIIGHIRHEMSHFLFLRLFENEEELSEFRELFGDESADYGDALKRYYAEGPAENWPGSFISAYASSHPHEDWAESCTHMLHLTDIVDSFYATGLKGAGAPTNDYDAYAETDPTALITIGARLGVALNHVNRSMGVADVYPFIHTPTIQQKLAFVHLALMASRPKPRKTLMERLRRMFGR